MCVQIIVKYDSDPFILYLRGPSPAIWTNLLLYLRGPSPAIWTTSPEFLKEVFIKDAETFIDRPMLGKNTKYLSIYLFIDRSMLGKNTEYKSIKYLILTQKLSRMNQKWRIIFKSELILTKVSSY